MRYIDIKRMRLPAGWTKVASKAYDRVKSSGPEQRNTEISRCSHVWRDLKASLVDLSYGKCWYCEARQERADNAVDHFRPKGRVTECEAHEGYWWLAFDWTNYRFSCAYCNSQHGKGEERKGKQDHFPLLEESARAHRPENDIEGESSCLLDPAVPSDPPLLWFNDEGHAEPKESARLLQKQRAAASISIYNLNHQPTVDECVILLRWIRDLVKAGNLQYDKLESGDISAEPELGRIMGAIMEAISPRAEFSAAARTCLMGLRDDKHQWIDDALRAH